MQVHDIFGLLIDHPGDAEGGVNLKEVRHETLIEAADALVADRLVGDVPNTGVPRRVHAGALGLEPGAQHVERVDDAGAECARRRAHDTRRERARLGVLLMHTSLLRPVRHVRRLEKLERAHVDRRVREHTDQAHRDATVGRPEAALGPHLAAGLCEQDVAPRAARHILRLEPGVCQEKGRDHIEVQGAYRNLIVSRGYTQNLVDSELLSKRGREVGQLTGKPCLRDRRRQIWSTD